MFLSDFFSLKNNVKNIPEKTVKIGIVIFVPHCIRCGRQVGDKPSIMQHYAAQHAQQNERQVKDKWETNVKSCGPGMQPFQRSKNPMQANLWGEIYIYMHGNIYECVYYIYVQS